MPKACQTLGNWTAPRTSPTRERTTEAKSGSTRNMKLREMQLRTDEQREGGHRNERNRGHGKPLWPRFRASIAASQKAITAGTSTAIERQRTRLSATPVLAEKAIVTSQK